MKFKLKTRVLILYTCSPSLVRAPLFIYFFSCEYTFKPLGLIESDFNTIKPHNLTTVSAFKIMRAPSP